MCIRDSKRGEGVDVQEDEAAGPVDHGSYQHTHQHGGLDALLGQQDDDKQTDEIHLLFIALSTRPNGSGYSLYATQSALLLLRYIIIFLLKSNKKELFK